MPRKATDTTRTTCLECGFTAETGGDEWVEVDHPTLGSLARCPECDSTNVTTM
jgi:predicted Zn-ribbon and HTH transcriptional regulator